MASNPRKQPGVVVIYWRSRRSGKEGHGAPIPRSSAGARLEKMKREYPTFDHWIGVEEGRTA